MIYHLKVVIVLTGEKINIIDNLIQAISILNKTDEYLESLNSRLSECDSLISDYEHLIENASIEEVNLEKLYQDMQINFVKRREIKNDMTLSDNYKQLTMQLNNSKNREFLLQKMKTAQSKLGVKYHNRILTDKDIEKFQIPKIVTKKKRGPKKMKEGV